MQVPRNPTCQPTPPLPLPPKQAFIEDVDTSILDRPPVQQPLVKILTARSEQWERLIKPGRDTERRELILGMVTDAVGLSQMMTEQSKEQEQEK